jgi:Domain of unknown function (DUF4430)
MKRSLAAVACALALAGLVAGCTGMRAKQPAASVTGHPPNSSEVRLVVSRDFGATVMVDELAPAKQGLDVMRLLAEHTTVDTSYGGQFVNGINGVRSTFGGVSTATAADWFYWVDGVLADVGAADWKLSGGDTVWWDYHCWSGAMVLPATLDAFPVPWDRAPLAVTADARVAGLPQWAAISGLKLAAGSEQPLGTSLPDGGLLVITRPQSAPAWLRDALSTSGTGVAVDAHSGALTLAAQGGAAAPQATAAALALANPRHAEEPVLLLMGSSAAAVQALLDQLTPANLTARVGVALVDGRLVGLPWQAP